ncbi:CHAT domain-containing protein [Crepidotus variabilis]|uniref:CHAT domain-containing protein n=1 Tax=Crepidotus variabilis TaxID=179855 RepID=A0A9P6EL64_9AGAR|nr:CHAT domain-containing protein [Crepidotus variabilis]
MAESSSSSKPMSADHSLAATLQLDGILFDIVIECSPTDAANPTLEGLQMAVVDAREQTTDAHPLDRTSPIMWRYRGVIELLRDMGQLVIIVQSEDAGEFGFLDLTGKISQYLGSMATVRADSYKHKLITEGEPSLWITFAVSAVEQQPFRQLLSVPLSKLDKLSETPDQSEESMTGNDCFKAGTNLLRRFQETGSLTDISNAIEKLQLAVSFTPEDHQNMPLYLNKLGNSLWRRFEQIEDPDDISAAVECHRKAVELTPEGHPHMPARLNNLGSSLFKHFEYTEDLADINAAIEHYRKSIKLTPEGHPDAPSWLNNLGSAFATRFMRTGDLDDISTAIEHHRKSVELTPEGHPDMPSGLDNLGKSFLERFDNTGDLDDLSAAIKHKEKLVKLAPEGHPSMHSWLNNLGNLTSKRFEQTRDLDDLSTAIEYQQKTVKLTPEGHPDLPSWLDNLGNSFLERFRQTGNLGDVTAAIKHHQKSVELTSERHPNMPSWLNNLGTAFFKRFEQTGDPDDIAAAIAHYQKSVVLTPEGHPNLSAQLNNLGSSFFARFDEIGGLSNLSAAIEHQQESVRLVPEGHSDMPRQLSNLGNSFLMRFGQTGDLTDLSAAIEHHQKSVELTPKEHPGMPSWLNNLGNSFLKRFEQTGDLDDIVAATEHYQKSVRLTPEKHPDRPSRLFNLGQLFFKRFMQTRNLNFCQGAAFNYCLAATQNTGGPTLRLRAAQQWAVCCGFLQDYPASLGAFEVALKLLPLVASLDQTVQNRHANLLRISGLTHQSVTMALLLQRVDLALEWFEQGRCLTWSQLNQLRTPVDDLRQHDARLAERFLAVSKALETSGSRPETSWQPNSTITQQIAAEDQVRSQLKLAKEWEQLLKNIRDFPNFNNFLLPPRASNILSQLPTDGPIVIINIDDVGCNCNALALIHGADEPIHIRLNNFTHEKAKLLRNQLGYHLTYEKLRIRDSNDRGGRVARRPDTGLHHILRELWHGVVWPILQGLGYSSPPAKRNRIWWCTTGPLTFLPIHAAGIYDPEAKSPGPCVSDFVVSSYIPTVTTLLEKLKNDTTVERQETKVLLLSQPNALAHAPIPGTTEETRNVLEQMKETHIEALLLEDGEGTKDRVTEEMGTHGWIHIASHASQHPNEPLKSGFYLHDGQLELLEIIRQQLPSAEFAFLSACQTSVGDEKLSEEAVHLAAGMLAAGYQGIVATMWSIKDQYAPKIAEDFYEFLLQEKRESGAHRLDSRRAAYALDDATRKIRGRLGDSESALLTWVPYIHLGL